MPRYCDFHVALPEVVTHPWRRFLLRSTATFLDLHAAIQVAFGWQDCHLFEFRLPGLRGRCLAGLPDLDDASERFVPPARSGDDPEVLREWLGDWRPDAWRVDAARATFDR